MAETIRYSPEGWTFYGTDFGGKVDGLLAFQNDLPQGIEVTPGIAIGASYFRQFVRENQFGEQHWPDDITRGGIIPDDLLEINRQILGKFTPGSLLFIRSSVIGENTGNGVYSSYPMAVTGEIETDLETLVGIQRLIYADHFSLDSRELLPNCFSDPNNNGVGLLIQPLIADRYGDYLMPAISGVATTVNGELALRLALGLGTDVVDMSKALVLKGENLDPKIIEKALFATFFQCDVLDQRAKTWKVDLEYQSKKDMVSQVAKLEVLLQHWKKLFDSGRPHYAEFAITCAHKKPQILQIHPEEVEWPNYEEIGPLTGRLLCESIDVVNQGVRHGRGIFFLGVNGPDSDDLSHLVAFNRNNNGYLLVASSINLSRSSRQYQITLRHFSNAAGVIERQHISPDKGYFQIASINHLGRGGAHFTNLCRTQDILFQGVPTPIWDDSLVVALGGQCQRVGKSSAYFALDFKMHNTSLVGRTEIFGNIRPVEYSRELFGRWIDELRQTAEILTETDEIASSSFYLISNHMVRALGSTVASYDPFIFVSELSPADLPRCRASLDHVLNCLHYTDSFADHQEGLSWGISSEGGNVFELEEYLLKLQSRVKERLAVL